MFIAIDGIDGAGKTTQIELLVQWLKQQGKQIATFREPGSTRLGESVREILLHREDIELAPTSEMLLYMASRAQLVSQLLRPTLERGEVVVCDRFLLASVVYQGAAGGLNTDDVWAIGRVATGGLRPDFTILLDLPVSVARSRLRGQPDRFEKRNTEYYEKVRQGFLDHVAQASPAYVIVDAMLSVEAMHQAIVDRLKAVWEVSSLA